VQPWPVSLGARHGKKNHKSRRKNLANFEYP
jgi:hypothetical protein